MLLNLTWKNYNANFADMLTKIYGFQVAAGLYNHRIQI